MKFFLVVLLSFGFANSASAAKFKCTIGLMEDQGTVSAEYDETDLMKPVSVSIEIPSAQISETRKKGEFDHITSLNYWQPESPVHISLVVTPELAGEESNLRHFHLGAAPSRGNMGNGDHYAPGALTYETKSGISKYEMIRCKFIH